MGFENIKPEEALKLIEEKNAIIIDVREKEEYDNGHIKGAKLVPLSGVQFNAENILEDKEQHLILHCHSGKRSTIACMCLADLGYKNIYNVGGIINWPYEIEK